MKRALSEQESQAMAIANGTYTLNQKQFEKQREYLNWFTWFKEDMTEAKKVEFNKVLQNLIDKVRQETAEYIIDEIIDRMKKTEGVIETYSCSDNDFIFVSYKEAIKLKNQILKELK